MRRLGYAPAELQGTEDGVSEVLFLIPGREVPELRRTAPDGREREPPAVNNKTQYVSEEGLTKLRAELEELVNVRRQEIAQRIHDAKEHGDLAENAEYEDAKNEQAFVEGQIQRLEALIKNATIIDGNHGTDHVQIGSTVKVEGTDGKEVFTIVGSTEASPRDGRISNESPVGRALLGKHKGESVVVHVPAGDFSYKILDIS
jgi:transcription elongation factor GreA